MSNVDGMNTAFTQVTAFLEYKQTPYRVMEHAPEGRTEEVSSLRGHSPREALKCIVVKIHRKKGSECLLLVIRGTQKVDFKAIAKLCYASYVSFAPAEKAQELTGCEMGTVLPFSFHPELPVIADESLVGDVAMVYFNAGALDKSVAMSAADYLHAANPKIAAIGEPLNKAKF